MPAPQKKASKSCETLTDNEQDDEKVHQKTQERLRNLGILDPSKAAEKVKQPEKGDSDSTDDQKTSDAMENKLTKLGIL
ncbi:hypothetical protein HDU85_006790 [Gaertneriomyces sp. JEL0708]|nr:hypothetical protein HDU85_006790 [Gaertneriomyces sp. JEL0708]